MRPRKHVGIYTGGVAFVRTGRFYGTLFLVFLKTIEIRQLNHFVRVGFLFVLKTTDLFQAYRSTMRFFFINAAGMVGCSGSRV